MVYLCSIPRVLGVVSFLMQVSGAGEAKVMIALLHRAVLSRVASAV